MLQEWLRDRCVPVVATLVTEDADIACRKNGLSFEQLVSAFARMDGLKVPFRSSSQQFSLDSFSCRFMRGSSMRPAPATEGDPSLSHIAVTITAEASAAAAKANGGDGAAGELLDSSLVEDQEWYKRYRAKLWGGLCHQEHEMLDCPAAVLVVVSSTEASGDPIACFDELSLPRYLPPPFQSRQYDPQSPTLVYVLLHDWCLGAARGVDPDRLLSQMRGTFTTGQCRLLCINSLPPESPNLYQKDIWPDAQRQGSNTGGVISGDGPEGGSTADTTEGGGGDVRGRCLSPEDLVATRDFVHGLATQVVVPSMERRILNLNATVSSVRKGVKNFMKSWLRKPRDSVEMHSADGGAAGGAKYRFDRIESQIRLLADSAFLMRDLDTAVAMYRMARDDFKSDRSLLHYASASEMLAISLYLQQQRRAAAAAAATPAASNSPVGSYIPSPSSGGLSGAIGGAIVGGVASAAATAANVATAAGAAGVRDLSWQGAGTAPAAGSAAAAGGALSPAVSSPRAGGQQQQQPHASGAPNSGSGGGSAIALNPSALLGRGREADAAFASALEAYQRRASEDSAAAAAGYGGRGGGGAAASSPPAARLGARAALLYADVAAAAAEDLADRAGPRSGLAGAGEELQAQAEEALLNASVLETPLCAAVLLEVSANRCREAGRLRRAAFRLIQAGHMYKTFAKDSGEAYRQQQQQQQGGSAAAAISIASPKFVGMHAARCFLGSLSGYSGSGWLAAEEYACTVLPTELRALQRPVAALQLYVRLVSAAGARREGRNAAIAGGGSSGALAGSSTHSQQQQQQKRAAREASLMVTFEDLCWRYPDAARVAARAWERGRETSKLDMSFFPITDRARGPPPPSRKAPAAAPTATPNSPHSNADLLGIDFDSSGEAEAEEEASGDGGGLGGGLVTAGVGEGVVFEELALPGVVHEETRPVDTENASVEASVKVTDGASWAQDMADALKAELAAADAVRAGEGPWLTLSASYGHKAGTLSSSSREPSSSSAKKPSHLPPPPRSAPVGEPVTVLVMLENLLAVPVTVEDLQLVLTAPAAAGEGQEEEEVACMALDEEEFQKTYSPKPATGEEALMDMLASSPPTPATAAAAATDATAAAVAIERRRATVPPGERLPVLLKFCALRPATAALTVSSVRWTVFQWNGGKEAGGTGEACPRVWVSHRLEGRGKLLHATLEQRAAKARAPAPPPRFEATGSMPWLGCSLEGVPPTLLQGEVVRATLNVTNRGRAPAGHLCLKTNLPWVAFEEPSTATIGGDEASATGGGATGGGVGASGTTLAPPVGVIMPGQSVALPLWVRGRGGGRQTVRMIVRYKRAPPSSSSSPSSAEGGGGERDGEWGVVSPSSDKLFRLERHAPVSLEMCVLPSLSVAASVLPSYSRRGEYVLSLEATNYRSNGDEAQGNRHLRIHKVCAISRCWRMEPLAGVPSKEEGGVGAGAGGSDEGGTIVHWQERITLHYRLFPVEGGDVIDGEEAPSVRHNDCTLGGTGTTTADWPGSEDSPHLPLLCLEQAASNYYQACRKHRQQKLAEEAAAADEQPRTIQGVRKERERENAIEALKKEEEDEERRWRTQRRAHPTSPDALCAPDVSLVHLMVLWGLDGSGDAPARVGQHHVRSLVIRPERVDRQCPLVLTVKYPSEVTWDGSSHVGAGEEGPRGCDAEVTVCATNRLAGPRENAKVNFTFEVRADDGPRRLSTVPGAPPPQASGGGGQGTSNKRPPRNRFVWLGPTRRRVVGLGPGEATTIPLKVRFLRPGVFDLNRFRFVVEFAPAAAASGKGKPATALPPSIPNTQQQRRDSSSSQQGRVTFVFPAQYLVTVAPSPPLPRPSSAVKTNKALVGAGGGMSPGSPALEEILVA